MILIKTNYARNYLSLLLIALLLIPLFALIRIQPVSAAETVLVPKWTRSGLGSNWEGGLVIGDVTGDGQEDVVFAGGGSDRIYVLDGDDGSTIATYTNSRIGTYCQPQLYDVDGNGVLDILVPLYYLPGLAAVQYDGDNTLRQMWIANTQGSSGSGSVMAKPVAGDIDGDGHLDIFVASQDVSPNGGYDGTVCRLDYRGNILYSTFTWRACSGGLSLADTDNDGVFELYQGDRQMGYSDGGYGKGERSFWADNLTERWNRLDFLSSSQAPALVDVNGDGVLDVVSGMYREMNVLNSATGEMIRRISNNQMSVHYGITVYDIDGDGHLELLCNDGDHDDDPYTDVYDLVTGALKAQLSLAGGDAKWSPLVADIDPTHPGMEIISCPNGTTVDNPTQSYWRGAIFVFSSDYQTLQTVTRDSNNARLSSQMAYPIVQDIDRDGRLELVTHASSGTVYAFDTSAPAPGYSNSLPGSHRIRSEVTYYGEKRTGVAVYEPAPGAPDYWTAPLVSTISPADNALAVPRSTNQLRFRLRDEQSNPLTYSVTTSPNVGSISGSISSGDAYNWNTLTVLLSTLAYDTTYSWTVTANDGNHVTTRTYAFRTELASNAGNTAPSQGNPTLTPMDGIGSPTSTFVCSAQGTSDPNGDVVTNVYRWQVNGEPAAQLLLPFDTRDATSTPDYSGNDNDGTVVGATWVPNGRIGGAYSFDGKDDAIIVSDGGAGYFNDHSYTSNNQELGGFGDWNAVTVEAWVYLRENNDGSRIVAKIPSYALGFQSGYTNRLYASVWPMTGQIANDDNAASSDRERSVSANTNMQLNRWYHIAFTYESGAGLKLYLDGQLIAQSSAYTGNVKISRGEPLYIGRLVQPFYGMIDDVRLYSYAVPADQIYNRYMESKDGSSSSSMFTPAGFSALGDTLTCDVIPTDSYAEGNTRSASRTLQNTPTVTYQLQVQAQGSGSTNPTGYNTYNAGTNVAVQATPANGWQLSQWLLDGANVGTTNPYTIIMNANHVCVAIFTELPSSAIFQDGFESGTFSAWTSTSSTSGETASVVTGSASTGAYSGRFTSDGQGGYEKAYAYESQAPALDEVYTQAYFRVTQNGIAESTDRIKLIELRAGSTIIAAAGLRQSSSTLRWWMETRNGATYVETTTSPVGLDLSEWFSLELRWRSDATGGGGSLWINGILIYEINSADTNDYGGCSQVRIGLAETYNLAATIINVDEVKIATSHIGP
jgi:hypothetical protein